MTPARRRYVELLSEGEGIHTDRFQRCLQHVSEKQGGGKKGLNSAYAICTATFQKAKLFKKGTADLTKKGRSSLNIVATEARTDLDEGKKGKKTPTTRLKNGMMGMRGGLISVGRIIRDELQTMRESPKHQKLYVELLTSLEMLEKAHAQLASVAAKVPENL